jgi:RNA recognition motif-containing protein
MAVRLFVGNLPYSATDVEIREHFSTVGQPSQIVVPTDRDTGRPRGFAFVDFDDRAVAERAIQQLDKQLFKGRPLAVSEARPREARPPMSSPGAPPPVPAPGLPRPASREPTRQFGPDKPPRRGGGFRKPQAERNPRGPLKERLTGRMFSVEEDSRDPFNTDDDLPGFHSGDTGLDEEDKEEKEE